MHVKWIYMATTMSIRGIYALFPIMTMIILIIFFQLAVFDAS
jgi:hypothetical protein